MPENEDQIVENALSPARVSIDGQSVEQHSIPDQIAADKYRLAKKAAKKGLGIRMVRMSKPGTFE